MTSLNFNAQVYERHARSLISQIQSKQYQTFDFGTLAFGYTMDLSASLIFGESTSVLTDTGADLNRQHFATDFALLGKMARFLTIFISQIPRLTDIVYWNEYKPTQRRVYCFVDSYVRKALQARESEKCDENVQPSETKPLVKHDTLAEAFAAQSTDVARIRTEILNLLLAGHDTVGIALSELFYCLARKPDVWRKLRDEVEETFHCTTPSLIELKRMKYLRFVINEGTLASRLPSLIVRSIHPSSLKYPNPSTFQRLTATS